MSGRVIGYRWLENAMQNTGTWTPACDVIGTKKVRYGTIDFIVISYRTVLLEKYRTVISYRTFGQKSIRTVPNIVPYRTVPMPCSYAMIDTGKASYYDEFTSEGK